MHISKYSEVSKYIYKVRWAVLVYYDSKHYTRLSSKYRILIQHATDEMSEQFSCG